MESPPAITELGGQLHLLAETMETDEKFNWTAFNPSIIQHGDKTYVTIRSSNYEIKHDGTYRVLWYGDVRNKIWLCELTSDYKLTNQRILEQKPDGLRRGLEDARIHHDANGKIRMYAIAMETSIPVARMVDCELNPELTEITNINVLPGLDKKRVEKNWVAPSGVKTTFDYWHSPGLVYTNGEFKNVQDKCKLPVDLRGSTPFIKHGDNLIGIMHTTREKPLGTRYNPSSFSYIQIARRIYHHYFVIMNTHGEILQVSKPFRFKITGIEFAAGIIETRDGYLVTYGAGDKIARLAVIPHDVVTTLLNPVQ